jgi:hypothetical protein
MQCPSCGHDYREASPFCGQCGARLGDALVCSGCGASNVPGQRFCGSCGQMLSGDAPGTTAVGDALPQTLVRGRYGAHAVTADEPLAVYAPRREAISGVIVDAIKAGDEPSVVGRAIVAAATDARPRLRYPAGTVARRVSMLRRYAPAAIFDKQIRKLNQLPA